MRNACGDLSVKKNQNILNLNLSTYFHMSNCVGEVEKGIPRMEAEAVAYRT